MPPGLLSKENGIIGDYWKSPSFKFIPKKQSAGLLENNEPIFEYLVGLFKGQIKSEWIYESIDFTNYQLKNLKDFCPERFEVEYL